MKIIIKSTAYESVCLVVSFSFSILVACCRLCMQPSFSPKVSYIQQKCEGLSSPSLTSVSYSLIAFNPQNLAQAEKQSSNFVQTSKNRHSILFSLIRVLEQLREFLRSAVRSALDCATWMSRRVQQRCRWEVENLKRARNLYLSVAFRRYEQEVVMFDPFRNLSLELS